MKAPKPPTSADRRVWTEHYGREVSEREALEMQQHLLKFVRLVLELRRRHAKNEENH